MGKLAVFCICVIVYIWYPITTGTRAVDPFRDFAITVIALAFLIAALMAISGGGNTSHYRRR